MYDNKLNSLLGGGALSDLSLLTVLDIHGNEFTALPSDIKYLSFLTVSSSENLFSMIFTEDKIHKRKENCGIFPAI